MKKINIQNEANIKAKGEHTQKSAKPVICIDTGEVYASTTDAAEAAGVHITTMSSVCLGKIRTANGKRYCYLSRVTESLDSIVTRLRETAAVEEDAKRWKAYQAEQEAIAKAEAKRLEEERKAEEKRQAAIVKLQSKLANLNVQCSEYETKWHDTINAIAEVERELEALGVTTNDSEEAA